jgi:Ni/Co efflux regulator RcnB
MLYFSAVVIFGIAASMAYAQGNGNGHGKGHDKDKHGDGDDDRDDRAYVYSYSKHDRDEMNDWYEHHRGNLPPGLAKKDRLPPGWEKKMAVHQVMPAEYREYVRSAPVEIVRVLPPPPPDCEHVVVGGHIVLMNRKTSVVLDIFNVGF